MCKHVLNAQVSICFGASKKFYDCHECYLEHEGEALDLEKVPAVVAMACKKCRQLFHKDMSCFSEEGDDACPHCGNRFVLPAMTPKSCLLVEARQLLDERFRDYCKEPLRVQTPLDPRRFDHLIKASPKVGGHQNLADVVLG
mmetsp:Transcript_19149/g.59031  ORF Transcript_19149/g.59031 Transcript_19149/m.59031 type:complete len:142 (+) Transcript_19149:135-560(+)